MKRSDFVPGLRVSLVREPSAAKMADCPGPREAAEIVRNVVPKGDEREHFIAILVDARNRVKGVSVISIGTLSASLVHPREVFRAAIVAGAAGVIIAHNHPSGECNPSLEDQVVTRQLKHAGTIIGIPLLDHVIVTMDEKAKHYSFRENGGLS